MLRENGRSAWIKLDEFRFGPVEIADDARDERLIGTIHPATAIILIGLRTKAETRSIYNGDEMCSGAEPSKTSAMKSFTTAIPGKGNNRRFTKDPIAISRSFIGFTIHKRYL